MQFLAYLAWKKHACKLQIVTTLHFLIAAFVLSGKNALHLSSRNGHSLCVQKLLQVTCSHPLNTVCTGMILLWDNVPNYKILSHSKRFFALVVSRCVCTHSTVQYLFATEQPPSLWPLRAVSLSAPLNNYCQTALAAETAPYRSTVGPVESPWPTGGFTMRGLSLQYCALIAL